jgi:NAD(P)H-flavin reductase
MLRSFVKLAAAAALVLSAPGSAIAQIQTIDPNQADSYQPDPFPYDEDQSQAPTGDVWTPIEEPSYETTPYQTETAPLTSPRQTVPREDIFTAAEDLFGRGTEGLALLAPSDTLDMVGPLGKGFTIDPKWKNIVVLGRGVGLATMAPISQVAGEMGVRVTAILSARSPDLALAADLFESVGTVIKVLDTDGTSSVENVESILNRLIREKKADAFYTCGSNRLLQLMKRVAREHRIPGQAAMEQIMACGLGPCYICVRTFEVNGKKEMRRVCVEGPVFDLQECLGW